MEELIFTFATAVVILAYFLAHVASRRFDPFAPIWLFLVGYAQVYVVMPFLYHNWAVSVRGKDLVANASLRAFWALLLLLSVYHLAAGRRIARMLPQPPRSWSPLAVAVISPILIFWGLYCAGMLMGGGFVDNQGVSAEETLLRSFPFVMMVAAILLIVTGKTAGAAHPAFSTLGLGCAAAYILIWMYNGKRSHALIGVLATVAALYIARLKRPSWPVLLGTSVVGSMVVAMAIGWRNDFQHERSLAGFATFLGEFPIEKVLESLGGTDADQDLATHETSEYGGFLLMMDTVPAKSPYDYGASYIRVVSTFIPRIIWPSKPVFGRSQWVSAWIAGSEMERDEEFTGPAIGILGAAQLNGGALGTAIVLACVALLLRSAYEYFREYSERPWAQFWWSITYYNAWFMVVNDDPLVWFYYNWGFTTCPIVVLLWWVSRSTAPSSESGLATWALT
jgi:hypothetical protein